jgi:hypothetical protein
MFKRLVEIRKGHYWVLLFSKIISTAESNLAEMAIFCDKEYGKKNLSSNPHKATTGDPQDKGPEPI